MLEEQTTTERPDYASMTLEELAASANENERRVIEAERAAEAAMGEAVYRAMDVGDALAAVREQVGFGDWGEWMEVNCVTSAHRLREFVRLAEHRPHVERWVLKGGDDGEISVWRAVAAIRGLPRVTAQKVYEDDVRKEAKRLRSEGVSIRETAGLLGVSPTTVRVWANPAERKRARENSKRYQQKRRAADRALKEKKEREERARLAARADDTGKAYSEVRKLTAALSQAIAGVDSAEARNHLREAERLALKAEESIVAALKELRTDGD